MMEKGRWSTTAENALIDCFLELNGDVDMIVQQLKDEGHPCDKVAVKQKIKALMDTGELEPIHKVLKEERKSKFKTPSSLERYSKALSSLDNNKENYDYDSSPSPPPKRP